jgi:hypothetical protein
MRSNSVSYAAERNVDRKKAQAISGACGLNLHARNAARVLQPGIVAGELDENTALNSAMKPAACPVVRAARLLNQIHK